MSTSHRMTPQSVSDEQRQKQKKMVMEEEVDFLEIDRPIPGQNFVCMSFLSPEAAIQERYLWYMKEFLNDLVKPIPQPEDMPDLEYKTKLHSILMHQFTHKSIETVWSDFLYSNKDALDSKYNEQVDFQTSTRGIKIRGTYDTYREAKNRSNQIARFDKKHNVYIGQVGYWLPWDPDPHELPEQEYQEKELNMLMKKYQENMMNKDEFFHARNKEKMEAALRSNKNAKKASEENKKELDKVRKTVTEKDEMLNKALEEQRKAKNENSDTSDNPAPNHPAAAVETKESFVEEVKEVSDNSVLEEGKLSAAEISSVFETEDPWLQRKQHQE